MIKAAKIKFMLLLIVVILGICAGIYFFSLKGEFCITVKDCPDLGDCGIDCAISCVEHRCTWISCEDHGTYDFETGKCTCHEGYTGDLCEQQYK